MNQPVMGGVAALNVPAHIKHQKLINWVADIAARSGMPWQVLAKERRGDYDVRVSLPDPAAVSGRTPVLIDDIVSSGHTIQETLAHLRRLSLPPPLLVAIHPVFAGDAYARLHRMQLSGEAAEAEPSPEARG